MPGQQLQTIALILARQPSGSDAFEQLTAFSAEHGLLHLLRRIKQTKTSATPLDLFDEAELWLESSSQGRTWFVKEHRFILRHDGIGRSYDALRAAVDLGKLVTRNPVPDESRAAVMDQLRTSFGALASGGRPDIVWIKSLYCLLRDEGYPVKQQWWPGLQSADREAATQILNQPVAGQAIDAEVVARVTRRLADWVAGETEIKL
jgi:hypothetical protein